MGRAPSAQVHLAVRDLAVGYPGRAVLAGVTFSAAPGERIGLVGENGTGKTTLLRVLAGDLPATSGEVRVSGSVAVVAQDLDVPSGATVGDVVAEALAGPRALLAELEEATADLDRIARGAGDDADDADAARHAAQRRLAEALGAAERASVWDADRRADEALTRFGAPRDVLRALETLSVGERYRVRRAGRSAERAAVLL
ncbi:MAG: ABC-F family ATP-binding cassette domain-containing protein, partial [Cellulomonadaceae bacterium]|nr:ABC-F family ATP-binding cassette domain-containing protein [Cellulomonadaceae bacterium]